MNRAFLEALGLDKETVEKVIAEHGRSVETQKSKVTDLTTERDDYKSQLDQRDKDLKNLKKKAEGSEELQTQLATLQSNYDTQKSEFEQKLKDTQLASAIKLALAGKVHDTEYAIEKIDKTLIELDAEGKVTKGLDEQLKTLQESKPFLFVPESKETKITGVVPATDPGGGGGTAPSVGANFAKSQNEKSKSQATSLWD